MPTDSAGTQWRAEGRRHVDATRDPDVRPARWSPWLAAVSVAVATFFVLMLVALGIQAGLGGDLAGVPTLPALSAVLLAVSLTLGLVAWYLTPR